MNSRSPEFNFSATLVNRQLVCHPPVGILNLVMFIWILIYHCLFALVLKSPDGEWPITLHLHFYTCTFTGRNRPKVDVIKLVSNLFQGSLEPPVRSHHGHRTYDLHVEHAQSPVLTQDKPDTSVSCYCKGLANKMQVLWSMARSLTCQGKNKGVWSRGTRRGATTTSSNNSPSNKGTRPISARATITHLRP